MSGKPGKPLSVRFWAKVDKTNDCWNWTGAISGNGYGSFWIGWPSNKSISAHRLSYELAHGPTPDGLVIDHKCHHRNCVNPNHLQAVPQKLNGENRGGLNSDNKSGVRGVTWNKAIGKYEARVRHNGKLHYGGIHETLESASEAVLSLRNRLHVNNLMDRITI